MRGTTKHYRVAEIARRHFNMTAKQCGLGRDMEPIVADVLARTPAVIESVGTRLPKAFPEGLFASVSAGLKAAAEKMEQMSDP
jgi:serine/threonine-protein kinase HipA